MDYEELETLLEEITDYNTKFVVAGMGGRTDDAEKYFAESFRRKQIILANFRDGGK